jgi:hypothetical protein
MEMRKVLAALCSEATMRAKVMMGRMAIRTSAAQAAR